MVFSILFRPMATLLSFDDSITHCQENRLFYSLVATGCVKFWHNPKLTWLLTYRFSGAENTPNMANLLRAYADRR